MWCASSGVFRIRSISKVVTAYTKFYAHDEKSEAKAGDRVLHPGDPSAFQAQTLAFDGSRREGRSRSSAPAATPNKDFMLQIRSILDVADNTGAKRAAAIGVLGRNQRYAGIGDVIKAHIKEAAPDGTVKKGEVVDAVVVRTRQTIRRNDGSYLRFDSNAIVIIDKEKNPARHAHLRPGRSRIARQEVHEDYFARAGGHLSMQKISR